MHHAAQSMLFTLAFLATVLYSVKAQTIIIPDCSSGNGSPTCVNGGTVINVASANPVLGLTSGWSFIASPQTDNVAWQLYSNISTSIIGNARCNGFTYSDLAAPAKGGNLWAVITLNAATNVTEQPLLGIFSNGQCPLIYSLPNGIIGGPIYIYTTADDGSRPEILTRIKMTSSAFVCNPPPSTIVEYILFGTMQVSVGSFVLQYAGYNSVLPRGCSASLAFTFPPSILAANPGLGVVNPVIPPGALLSTSPNTITTNAGAGLLMTPAVVVANPQLSVVNLVTVAPTPKSQQTGKGELPFGTPLPPKVVDTSPARDNKGAKNDKGLGKGKQKFLRS